jgi:hypothetical protein
MTAMSRGKDAQPVNVALDPQCASGSDAGALPCNWHQDGEDCTTYATSCGHYFEITDGSPSENRFKFCCYCGKPVEESLHIIEDEA